MYDTNTVSQSDLLESYMPPGHLAGYTNCLPYGGADPLYPQIQCSYTEVERKLRRKKLREPGFKVAIEDECNWTAAK